jgi:hypothetical protein
MDFDRIRVWLFPQRLRSHSGGNSRLDRREKWRKSGGGGELRKKSPGKG